MKNIILLVNQQCSMKKIINYEELKLNEFENHISLKMIYVLCVCIKKKLLAEK